MRFLKTLLAATAGVFTALFIATGTLWIVAPPPARAQLDALGQLLLALEQTYGPASLHVQGSSGNVANATATATLPASTTGRTTYISHFRCTGGGATAASIANITVAGVATSMVWHMGFGAGVTTINTPVDHVFDPPVPASAPNQAITVTMAAGGAGNTNAACNAEGFQL